MDSSQDISLPNTSNHQVRTEHHPEQDRQYGQQRPNSPRQNNAVVLHPNGSEGWLPTDNSTQPIGPTNDRTRNGFQLRDPGVARAASVTSRHSTSLARSGSRRSTQSLPFANGPGTSGICAAPEPEGEARTRLEQAQSNLTSSQKSKIAKVEAENGRRLSRIIKEEAKVEKKTLDIAINELADLQRVQKDIVKNMARVQANHSKLLAQAKKREAEYLIAKRKFEAAQAALTAEEETLETLRNEAADATERMQDKSAEVDALRHGLAVDEREREVVLTQLRGPRKGLFSF